MSAERRCEICGGESQERVYEINGFPIVRCRTCGLVFVGRTPAPDELAALYDVSYWEDPEAEGYEGYGAAEGRKRHHFQGLLAQLESLRPPGELLEVGSAYGYFLDEARRRGWRVRGVEPSDHAARHAREALGLDVSSLPFEQMPAEREAADAIALWDVIEHLPTPRRTLERAHLWLRPGGVVAISTGDVGSLSARLHGRDWSLLTPPWHQFYFSRKTMRALLEDLGFEVLKIHGDGVVAVDATSSRPRVPRRLAGVLRHDLATRVGRRLGAGMTMFVVARKATRGGGASWGTPAASILSGGYGGSPASTR